MNHNHYDEQSFFEQYSKMDRSRKGLSAAGEWHQLKQLLPDFKDKQVLDLGCGFGWHCRYAVEQGAAHATGVDLSQKMLQKACELTDSPNITYLRASIDHVAFDPDSFDVVISSLAFHYLPDFGEICRRIHRFLKPGGAFVFSVEHPVFTAEGAQDWHYNGDGTPAHWPVDSYFTEGRRTATFLGESITKYHKTLTTYLNDLLQNGFRITAVVEPQPAAHLLELPGMKDELRRPMMLLVSSLKE